YPPDQNRRADPFQQRNPAAAGAAAAPEHVRRGSLEPLRPGGRPRQVPRARLVGLRGAHRPADARADARGRLWRAGPAPASRRLPRASGMNGYLAAAVAVLIWASYPVATRAGVTGAFAPQELVTLRFGVGALLFLPYLLWHGRAIARKAWLRGVPLTLFQGAGMGALVIGGLQFAPANHQAALGPGVSPAWVALLGFLIFARRPSPRAVLGATLCALGVVSLAGWSALRQPPA